MINRIKLAGCLFLLPLPFIASFLGLSLSACGVFLAEKKVDARFNHGSTNSLAIAQGVFVGEFDNEGLNIPIAMGRTLRGPRPAQEYEDFLDNTTFTAKHTPDIYIIFNDTWRRDHVTPELMPNVYKFQQTYVNPERAHAGASATYHSMFSLLHGVPAYLNYPFIRHGFSGSLPIRILVDKLGYQFHLDSYGNEIDCLKEHFPTVGAKINFTSYAFDYQLHFGSKMHYVHECRHSPATLGNNLIVPQKKNPASTYARNADMDRGLFASTLTRTATNKTGHHIYFIHTQGLHDPYSWREDLPAPSLFHPSVLEEKFESSVLMQNSYKNAVMSFDRTFGEFIAQLQAADQFDNALIILFGDHGEYLGEKLGHDLVWFHGSRPYRDRVDIPMMFKFPGKDSNKAWEHATFSSYDMMPTILDYLGVEDYGQRFYFGASLLSPAIRSSDRVSICIRPNQSDDTFEMALINRTYKIIIRVQKDNLKDMLLADGFNIVAITDLNDIPIESSAKFAKFGIVKGQPLKFADEFSQLIKRDFRQGLHYLFPSACKELAHK